MRRPLLGLALLAGALAVTAQQASTANNAMPAETTAVYRATSVANATAVSLDYTMTGGTITTVVARLQKTDLLTTTVTAAFGGDLAVTCAAGLITILDTLTNLGEADYTCTGFTERADKPRPLTITAS